VSISIPDATTIAITGRSGSGKSTLMQVMSGLDRPQTGNVMFDDINIHKLPKRKLDKFHNEKIGFVFQSFYTLPKETVWKNVALPLELLGIPLALRKQRALKMLEYVGLTNYAERQANELSGGQLQRVCVSRALITSPKYIFADEPTGNLDPITGNMITKLLFAMNERFGSTLVIVTHNPELAKLCQYEIVMYDGKLSAINQNKR
jgi:putative ABC transport system ATP-binding protein